MDVEYDEDLHDVASIFASELVMYWFPLVLRVKPNLLGQGYRILLMAEFSE